METLNPVIHEDTLADLRFYVRWEARGPQLGFIVTWEDGQNRPDVFDQAMSSRGEQLAPTYMRGSFRSDGSLRTYQGTGHLSFRNIGGLRRHTALLTYLYRKAYTLFREKMGVEVDQLMFK